MVAGCDHAELGAEILDRWNFPESITDSIRNHHSPELSSQKLTSLLYFIESTERADEDLPSATRFEAALSMAGMSKGQFEDAYLGQIMQIAC